VSDRDGRRLHGHPRRLRGRPPRPHPHQTQLRRLAVPADRGAALVTMLHNTSIFVTDDGDKLVTTFVPGKPFQP